MGNQGKNLHFNQIRNKLGSEILGVKKFATSLSKDDLLSGGWLEKLINEFFAVYTQKTTLEYFVDKYRGLPPAEQAKQHIKEIAKKAGLVSAVTTSACSAALIGTAGSVGSTSIVTVPTSLAAFAADLICTTYLQMKLVYDLSVIYGKPLDLANPTDLDTLLDLAFPFAVKKGPAVSSGKMATGLVKHYYSHKPLGQIKNLPLIGKLLLKKKLSHWVVPLVAIPLDANSTYRGTKKVGKRAEELFKR